jgi:prepilin-type N-terminal cleavage/methylation domain-containing protein
MLFSKMKDKQGGFTLIELMFTVVVLAVLLAIGIPNFRDFLRNSRMAAQANDLLSGVNLTRSEAVKRRAPVTLCPGTAAAGCDVDGDFADGWIVFVDPNGDGSVDVDEDADADGELDPGEDVDGDGVLDTAESTQNILREHDAMPEGMVTALVETAAAEDDDAPDFEASDTRYLSFGQNGFRRMNDGSLPVALALVLCDARDNVQSAGGPDVSAARALELTTSGRAAITRSVARIDTLGGCP